jgi:hypothetical protein
MSEAPTTPTTTSAPAPAAIAPASSLYAASGETTTTAPAGEATVAGGEGTDTITAPTGEQTVPGAAGADALAGESTTAPAGEATVPAGEAGADSIAAPEYSFTLPEGFTQDATLDTEAKKVFAEAGVPADKAQGLVDLFAKALKTSSETQVAAHNAQQATWLTEINALPEFTGPTRETSLASIGRLFDEYGTPEARAAMNLHGIGNNPALAKMMAKVAAALTEGTPAPGGRPPTQQNGARKATTVGGSLYPDAK